MTNKDTGKVYPGQHYFLDGSDVGDATTQRPAALDEEITSIGSAAEIAKITDGPLMVQYQIKVTMMLPKDAARDESQRNPEKVAYPITTTVTLRKGAKSLEFRTELTNTVKDHKLRAMFPSHYPGVEKAFAETHFAVTERKIELPDTSTWKEPMRPEYPQYMFCGVEGKKDGMALLNVGLPEYAVYDDEVRTIGLSLVRTYRFPIIGADPEDVAVDETQVGTQCLRPFVFDYALYPYDGSSEKGGVFEQAKRFNLKMRLNQTGRSTGTLPNTLSFINVKPAELVLSAVKKAARSDAMIVRVYNPTSKTVSGDIAFWKTIESANEVNLNEKVLEKAEFADQAVKVKAGPNKIVSFEVKLK